MYLFFACCFAEQNVPTLTTPERERVNKTMAFAENKDNAEYGLSAARETDEVNGQ
jgi:hypothetical protein